MIKKMYIRRTGFTLVEVMIASTIGAFISMVAVGTLQTVIASNRAVDHNTTSASEVRFAASLIKRDLVNFYRDENTENMKFYGTYDYTSDYDYETSVITFYTLNRTKARVLEPEGDLYEVEYYLLKDDNGTSKLMRRVWPYPNEDIEPGGVVTVIAENIAYFEVTYYDSETETWYTEWTEEMTSLPHLIQVSIIGDPQGEGLPVTDVFIFNLIRTVTNTTETESTG